MTPLAYSVNDALRLLGIGRTKFYALVKNGAIPTRKLGTRTLVLAKDLEAFIDGLPAGTSSPE
jgi:excisionase family DNA binding protein